MTEVVDGSGIQQAWKPDLRRPGKWFAVRAWVGNNIQIERRLLTARCRRLVNQKKGPAISTASIKKHVAPEDFSWVMFCASRGGARRSYFDVAPHFS